MTDPRPIFEYLVKTALLADPEITGYIADRITPVKRHAEAAFPSLTYTVITDPLIWGCMGYAHIQVSCFALTYDAARHLEKRVQAVLDDLGVDGTGIEISGIDTDLPGMRGYEPDTGVYHHAVDALVTYIYR